MVVHCAFEALLNRVMSNVQPVGHSLISCHPPSCAEDDKSARFVSIQRVSWPFSCPKWKQRQPKEQPGLTLFAVLAFLWVRAPWESDFPGTEMPQGQPQLPKPSGPCQNVRRRKTAYAAGAGEQELPGATEHCEFVVLSCKHCVFWANFVCTLLCTGWCEPPSAMPQAW